MATPNNHLTPEQEALITEGFAQGLSRNEIARRVGCSGSLITRRAKKAGHTFARTAETAAATEAALADHEARRMQLKEKALLLTELLYEKAITTAGLEPGHYAALSKAIVNSLAAEQKILDQDKATDASPIIAALDRLANAADRLPGE